MFIYNRSNLSSSVSYLAILIECFVIAADRFKKMYYHLYIYLYTNLGGATNQGGYPHTIRPLMCAKTKVHARVPAANK